jgi:glucose-6-phosphate isomerase
MADAIPRITDTACAFTLDCARAFGTGGPGRALLADGAVAALAAPLSAAHGALGEIRGGKPQGDAGIVNFMHLPHLDGVVQPEAGVNAIENWAAALKGNAEVRHVVYIGIGGSGLGPILLHDALRGAAWNRTSLHKRGGRPTLDFVDNVDPETVEGLRRLLDFGKTYFVVTSKSGTTVEPLAVYDACAAVLDTLGLPLRGRLGVITEPGSALWKHGEAAGADCFAMPPGIGGRWSVLSPVGLVPAAVAGADLRALLAGAAEMDALCRRPTAAENPAYAYAAVLYAAHRAGVRINAIMPYRDRLRTLASWATQLFMESLGKKYTRPGDDGERRTVHCGYTVLPSRGTADQHSTGQEMIEGPADKIVTYLRTEDPGADFTLGDRVAGFPKLDYLKGRAMSRVLRAFQVGTADALHDQGRPSVTVTVRDVSERTLG